MAFNFDLSDDKETTGVGKNCVGCGKKLKLYDAICTVKDGFAHLPCTVNPMKKALKTNVGDKID